MVRQEAEVLTSEEQRILALTDAEAWCELQDLLLMGQEAPRH